MVVPWLGVYNLFETAVRCLKEVLWSLAVLQVGNVLGKQLAHAEGVPNMTKINDSFLSAFFLLNYILSATAQSFADAGISLLKACSSWWLLVKGQSGNHG